MLIDSKNRIINYMRISITDRCSLRCLYCKIDGAKPFYNTDQLLTDDEILRVVEAASELGVIKIRLTGGEPLIREGLPYIIEGIRRIPAIQDISLTTNAMLLERHARHLARCGLNRVNISLDSMLPERFREITGGGELSKVWSGIEASVDAGLLPIKLNMVVMKGINDDEIEEFVEYASESGHQVRFIEIMPLGENGILNNAKYISTEEIKKRVETVAEIAPVKQRIHGAARYYHFTDGSEGVIGFISAISNHFCSDCNRLRLTPDGHLRPCLFSDTEIDLKTPLRTNAPKGELKRLLYHAVKIKPGGRLEDPIPTYRPMSKLGG